MVKAFECYPPTRNNLYFNLGAEETQDPTVEPSSTDDMLLEYVRVGKVAIPSSVVLTPYYAPGSGTFVNEWQTNIALSSKPYYFVGDKNILVFAFVGDTIGAAEKYTFTPALYHNNNNASLISCAVPITIDFSRETDDYGQCVWKISSSLYISRVVTRIIGAAKYVRVLSLQRNYDGFGFFPNLGVGKIYLGAI